ncbi:unnamed protein product [Closterium sp. Yama58-4]|nr:unnamed protein product [Closterium sp. Yama58-4]
MSRRLLLSVLHLLYRGYHEFIVRPAFDQITDVILLLEDDDRNTMRRDRENQRARWDALLDSLPQRIFHETFRVNRAVFDYLVEAWITRNGDRRRVVPIETVVAMTLVYLGTGATFRQVGLQFGVVPQHAFRLIYGFIAFLVNVLEPLWVTHPTLEQCEEMAAEFTYEGGIPGVIGALDGTFIECRGFGRDKEDFKNRKGFYSIHLQIACDSNGIIWDYNVGYPGSVNDSRVFNNSPLRECMEAGDLGNYMLVSDAAYALKSYTCVPWRATPGRALPRAKDKWNTQQSRQRMVVEQVNGRSKGKWRILDARMECHSDRVPQVVSACVAMHNIELTIGSRDRLGPPNERDRWWLAGPASRLRLTGAEVRGFTPRLRMKRWTAAIYASYCVAHPRSREAPPG